MAYEASFSKPPGDGMMVYFHKMAASAADFREMVFPGRSVPRLLLF